MKLIMAKVSSYINLIPQIEDLGSTYHDPKLSALATNCMVIESNLAGYLWRDEGELEMPDEDCISFIKFVENWLDEILAFTDYKPEQVKQLKFIAYFYLQCCLIVTACFAPFIEYEFSKKVSLLIDYHHQL